MKNISRDVAGGTSNEIYFIGIGGIGMSSLARYFLSKGFKVSGYDRTETELTRQLVQEGALIHFEEDLEAIPEEPLFVVYTPAVPQDHQELAYYRGKNIPVVKRSDVLQAVTADSYNICTAGTHGKTTITTMIAHILRHSGYGCNAFLGGISVNYNSNFWSSENKVSVVEADEYDRSFLKLSPDIAIITSMDADHLDIYGNEEEMQDAFIQFGNKVKEDGLLISKHGLKNISKITVSKKLTYSLQNDAADVFAENIKIQDGSYAYDISINGRKYSDIRLNIGGMHNVENSVAAIAVASHLEIEDDKIRKAIEDFKGVKRRFEYLVAPSPKIDGAYVSPVLIDDYAHHPEEIRAVLSSVRNLFKQRKITVVFQPHLFTRTRDLAKGFASSLSIADRVILLPIYPARELPIEGVSSDMILRDIDTAEKMILDKKGLLSWLHNHMKVLDKEFGEVFVMAGAGDIDTLLEQVKNIIEKGE